MYACVGLQVEGQQGGARSAPQLGQVSAAARKTLFTYMGWLHLVGSIKL